VIYELIFKITAPTPCHSPETSSKGFDVEFKVAEAVVKQTLL